MQTNSHDLEFPNKDEFFTFSEDLTELQEEKTSKIRASRLKEKEETQFDFLLGTEISQFLQQKGNVKSQQVGGRRLL